MLTAKRIARRGRSSRSASSARCCSPLYSMGAAVYVPHLFSSYATRYGVIGAVFAMISSLFCMMVVVVASAASGREVYEELAASARGERPRRRRGPPGVGRDHRRGALALGRVARADRAPAAGEPEPVQQGAGRDPRVDPGE